MGKNNLSSSGRRRKRNTGVKNRWQKIQESKAKQQTRSIVIENAEFLSKGQMKKLAKQPLNAIRASGKRKRKVLKQMGHKQREKMKEEKKMDKNMEVETEQKKKRPKKDKVQNMDVDEVEEDVDSDENSEEMAS